MWLTPFKVEKLFSYLVFFTGFFGVALFAIDLGFFTLFAYRILLVLLWGLVIIRALTEGKLVFPQEKIRLFIQFFVVWIIYAIISLAWAESKIDGVRNIIFLFLGVSVILFAIYYFKDKRDLNKLYWMWFGAFWILVLLGFWEHLTGQHLSVSRLYSERLVFFWHRPTGVFYNPNDYATFLAISIPFMLVACRYVRNIATKIIGVLGMIAAFYLIVITGSRANTLAVIIELVFVLFFLTNLSEKLKAVFTSIICLIIALPFLPVNLFSMIVSAELSSLTARTEVQAGSIAIRSNLARNCLEFLYPTAGLGVGSGNVEYWMENFARHNTAGILNAHNWWLEILTNYGILIFICYIAVYLWLIIRLWRSWCRTNVPKERMITEALLLSLVGFSVASISSSSIMAFEPNWMLFAFALAFLNHRHTIDQ
ncbi:MAG: O-antigen ligase family protein [bacterium]